MTGRNLILVDVLLEVVIPDVVFRSRSGDHLCVSFLSHATGFDFARADLFIDFIEHTFAAFYQLDRLGHVAVVLVIIIEAILDIRIVA